MTVRTRSGPILRTLTTLLLLGTACQPAASAPPTPGTVQPTAGAVQPTAAAAKPTAGQPAPTTAPATQPAAKTGGQVVYAGVGSDVRVLNPILQSDTVSSGITDRLFEPLVQEDPKTRAVIPVRADAWPISPDRLSYPLKLRRRVTLPH